MNSKNGASAPFFYKYRIKKKYLV